MHSLTDTRLSRQQITAHHFTGVSTLVKYMGAVQAQDYAMAKWALGLRLPAMTEGQVEEAINNREIIRTHVLRPTWHFVAAEDIRWMMQLSAPQIKKAMVSTNRQLGLDETVFTKTNKLIEKLLKNGEQLTREEIVQQLEKSGIATTNLSATHIMMVAELDLVVCNGCRRGKQFTYALFDSCVPAAPPMKREEALAQLAMVYFTSHGPATAKDFVWWSGLSATEAQQAIASIKSSLESVMLDGVANWLVPDGANIGDDKYEVFLVPPYDEYLVSYADRTATLPASPAQKEAVGNGIFKPVVVHKGKVIGAWRRTDNKKELAIDVTLLKQPTKTNAKAIGAAASRFGKFMEKKVSVNLVGEMIE